MNIKYPVGTNKDKKINKVKTFGNRGMTLEDDLNLTNNYYLEKNIAVIHKKPTPIQVIKTSLNKITLAYFKEPSTTDYNGLYKGKYIDFEAKETNSKTSFSMSNIHPHQIKHLINVARHGAISFLIVRFNKLSLTYFLSTKDLEFFIKNYERKSIPLSFFNKYGKIIKTNYQHRLDYIEIINNLYFEGNKDDEEKK